MFKSLKSHVCANCLDCSLYAMCLSVVLDRIRSERIRGTSKVGKMFKAVQESRSKWYGHVLRTKEEYVGKRVVVMEGKEGEGDRSGGGWIT